MINFIFIIEKIHKIIFIKNEFRNLFFKVQQQAKAKQKVAQNREPNLSQRQMAIATALEAV